MIDVTGPTLKPRLTLFDSLSIVAGSTIGSGIFIVSAGIAREVRSPALLLLVFGAIWLYDRKTRLKSRVPAGS